MLIDLPKLVADLRALAAQYPNAVYRQPPDRLCQSDYGDVENGPPTPGCIVGQALRLQPAAFDQYGHSNSSAFSILATEGANEAIKNWVQTIQNCQDYKNTWHIALKSADELYPLPKEFT